MTIDELQNADRSKVLLVDIRERDEVVVHPGLPGSVNIPMSEILQTVEAGKLPMDKKIVTICRSGGRCFVVNSELTARGYDTDMLEGGLIGNQW
jgi:rhodanese-related sulfurtransferase